MSTFFFDYYEFHTYYNGLSNLISRIKDTIGISEQLP